MMLLRFCWLCDKVNHYILYFTFYLLTTGARAGSCYLFLCYRDCRDEEEADPRVWNNFHEDDILSAAIYPTGLVATSAYDGVVKVWNIESGHVNCKLTADNYGLETTRSLIPADVKRQVSYGNAGMGINEINVKTWKTKRLFVKTNRVVVNFFTYATLVSNAVPMFSLILLEMISTNNCP